MTEVLDHLEAQTGVLAPAFVMLDPFGISGTPMSVIERILRNSQSEVYVSFMYEAINRFRKTEQFAPHLDVLFGCKKWREGVDISEGEKRKDFFYGLYEEQLRKAAAKHVVHFDLYEGDRLVYAIFFSTKHWKGSDRMKQAVWKVAPFGDFAFRGTKSRQLTLVGIENPDFKPLQRTLQKHFRSKGWVRIEDVLKFVASDKTDYHTGQVKKCALVPLEQDHKIKVDEKTRKQKRTYPKRTRLRFL